MLKCRGAELLHPLGNKKCPAEDFGEGKDWSRVCKAHSRILIPSDRVIKVSCPTLPDSTFEAGSAIVAKLEERACISRSSLLVDAEHFSRRSAFVMSNEVIVVVDAAENTAVVKGDLETRPIEGVTSAALATDDVAFLKCNVHKSMCPESNFCDGKDGSCAIGRWKQHVYYKAAGSSTSSSGRSRENSARSASARRATADLERHERSVAMSTVAAPSQTASLSRIAGGIDPRSQLLQSSLNNLPMLTMRLQAWLMHPAVGLCYSLMATHCSNVTQLISRHAFLSSAAVEERWVESLFNMVVLLLTQTYEFNAPNIEAANVEYQQFRVFVPAGMECQMAIAQVIPVLTFMGQLLQFYSTGHIDPFTWLARSIPETVQVASSAMLSDHSSRASSLPHHGRPMEGETSESEIEALVTKEDESGDHSHGDTVDEPSEESKKHSEA